jgi:hypothetical protein
LTGVTSFILLADIGGQDLKALHLNFEGGNHRIFGVNDNVSCFSLKFEADGELHVCGGNLVKIARWRLGSKPSKTKRAATKFK